MAELTYRQNCNLCDETFVATATWMRGTNVDPALKGLLADVARALGDHVCSGSATTPEETTPQEATDQTGAKTKAVDGVPERTRYLMAIIPVTGGEEAGTIMNTLERSGALFSSRWMTRAEAGKAEWVSTGWGVAAPYSRQEATESSAVPDDQGADAKTAGSDTPTQQEAKGLDGWEPGDIVEHEGWQGVVSSVHADGTDHGTHFVMYAVGADGKHARFDLADPALRHIPQKPKSSATPDDHRSNCGCDSSDTPTQQGATGVPIRQLVVVLVVKCRDKQEVNEVVSANSGNGPSMAHIVRALTSDEIAEIGDRIMQVGLDGPPASAQTWVPVQHPAQAHGKTIRSD